MDDRLPEAPDQDLLDGLEVDDLLGPVPAFGPAVRQYASAARRSLSNHLERERILLPPSPKPPNELDDESYEEPQHVSDFLDDEDDEPTCRVCLTGDEPEADDGEGGVLGALIQPCLCSGSVAWIHVGCLTRWRQTSASSTAAAACPQCGMRYRFSPPRGGPAAVWAIHCQPLRLLAAGLLVIMLACSTGLVAMSAIQLLGRWTPTASLIQSLTSPPLPMWTIELSDNQPLVTITHYGAGRPGDSFNWLREPVDSVARSSLQAIKRVLETKRTDPVWVDLAWPATEHENLAQHEYLSEPEQQDAAAVLNSWASSMSRFWPSFTSPSLSTEDALEPSVIQSTTDSDDYYLPLFHITEEDAEDDLLFWGAELQPARSPADLDIDSLIEASAVPDPTSFDPEVRLGIAQRETLPNLRQVTIRHIFTATFTGIPRKHDRANLRNASSNGRPSRPGNKGERLEGNILTQVIFIVFSTIVMSMMILVRVIQLVCSEGCRALLEGLSRSGAGLLAIFDSHHLHRDGFFLFARMAMLAVVALLRQHFQAAPTLPRILPGYPVPVRSRTRVVAGWALQVVLAASPALLGPYWADWWGGYPLSVFGRPGIAQELFFAQTLTGSPGLPIIADSLLAPLATVSKTVARIRAATTSRWTSAPWTVPDDTAAEGTRRLVRALLDREDPYAQRAPLDVYRDLARTAELPAGHIKPWDVVSLVTTEAEAPLSLLVRLRAAVTLGAPIIVAVAMVYTMVMLSRSHLWIFWNQIGLSSRRLFYEGARFLLFGLSRKIKSWLPSSIRCWTGCASGRPAETGEPTQGDQARNAAPEAPEAAEQHANFHLRLGNLDLGVQIGPFGPAGPFGDERIFGDEFQRDEDLVPELRPDRAPNEMANAVDPEWMNQVALQADQLAGAQNHPVEVDGIAEPGPARAAAAAARAAAAAGVHVPPRNNPRPPRGAQFLTDFANLYGSLEIILNHLRVAATVGPFLPFAILYARLRLIETKCLLQGEVLDLSKRRV